MPHHQKALVGLVLAALALAGCTAPDGTAATRADGTPPSVDGTDAVTATLDPAFPLQLQELAVVPATADLGDQVVARALAKNVGPEAATARIEFRLAGQLVSTATATLEPGESTLVAATLRPGRPGSLPVEAKVVESGAVLTTTFLVHGPDLVDPAVKVLDLQQCDRVGYRVSFRNAGDGAAQGVSVEAQLRDTDGAVVDRLTQEIGDVAAGASTLLEFTHVAPARCTAVQHTYTVHVIVRSAAGVTMEHDSAPFTV